MDQKFEEILGSHKDYDVVEKDTCTVLKSATHAVCIWKKKEKPVKEPKAPKEAKAPKAEKKAE